MYTWGYVKEATLAKMDMSANQAIDLGLVNKMPYYANEALTQITSGIKPKIKYIEFKVKDCGKVMEYIKRELLPYDDLKFLVEQPCDKSTMNDVQLKALELYNSYRYIGQLVKMPDDYIAWSDEPVYKVSNDFMYNERVKEVSDKDFTTVGYKSILFKKEGIYRFPYKAKWFMFTPTTNDDVELDIPDDIVECLPSYIASQLFKIDDEQKSSIYRNEFEMMVARIDENEYFTNKEFNGRGDW